MLTHVYSTKDKLLIPQLAVTTDGFYLETEPVEVLALELLDVQSLASAIRRVKDRGNPTVPTPSRLNFPVAVLPALAGRKSWTDFAKHAQLWRVRCDEYGTSVTPTTKAAKNGGFTDVSPAAVSIPSTREEEIAGLLLSYVK
jgi:hypothetical protein